MSSSRRSTPSVRTTSVASATSAGSIPSTVPVGRVHQHERAEPLGHRQREVLGDHAAHRVAEQREPVPAELVDQPAGVVRERRERVVRLLGRLTARPVAPVVGRDDVEPACRERVDPVGEVLLRTREAVEEQQPRATAPGLRHGEDDRARVHLDQLHLAVLSAPGRDRPWRRRENKLR